MKSLSKQDAELLHRYLDGEVSEAERAAFETRLQEDAELRRRWEAGRELGGLVRAYAAYGLESAAGRLEGLIDHIENAADAGGTTALTSRRKLGRAPDANAAQRDRAKQSVRRRRNFIWAAASMLAAAAALFLVLGPLRSRGHRGSDTGATGADAVAHAGSNQADIEQLDVPSSAAVFTIPDDQGDKSTTVIWVSDPEPPSPEGAGPP